MRFYLFGPRIFGVRTGISLTPQDFKTKQTVCNKIQGSFVYVVRGDHNMVKIGVSTNPDARLAQLRTGSAFPIDFAFLGCTPGDGFDIEAAAHAILTRQRCAGEWFDVSPELAISAVMGAAARLKQPLLATNERTASKALRIAAKGGSDEAARQGFRLFLLWMALSALAFYGLWEFLSGVEWLPPPG